MLSVVSSAVEHYVVQQQGVITKLDGACREA